MSCSWSYRRTVIAKPAALAVLCFGLPMLAAAGCTGAPGDGDQDSESTVTDAEIFTPDAADAGLAMAEPTVVPRRATPTLDPAEAPLHPILTDELPDVPVPLGARRDEFEAATEETDALAHFEIDGVDQGELEAWFREHMAEHGWREDESAAAGGLVFEHESQQSARFASEGLPRTASVIFETLDEDHDFTLIVEAPSD